MILRLGSLLVLSIVLLSPIDETTQGIIAVLAVLAFVCGFALGMGAGENPFLCLQVTKRVVMSMDCWNSGSIICFVESRFNNA